MARIPAATEENVPPRHLEAFRAVMRDRAGLPHTGPSVVMLHSPEAARRARHLSDYLRNNSVLPRRAFELAVLVAAREMDSAYIWHEHAAHGRQAGLPDALVDALRDRKALPKLAPEDAAVVNYALELFHKHRVSPAAFQNALKHFGVQGVTEMTMAMGYYTMGAFCVNAFEEAIPRKSAEPPLPV